MPMTLRQYSRRLPSTQERPFALPLSENDIQRAVFQHLRERGTPTVFAFHPKNGGIHQRGRRRGINAGLGVVSGVPDVIVFYRGHAFCLELKAEKGKLSNEQLQIAKDITRAGMTWGVTYGLDEALRWLEAYDLLVGSAA